MRLFERQILFLQSGFCAVDVLSLLEDMLQRANDSVAVTCRSGLFIENRLCCNMPGHSVVVNTSIYLYSLRFAWTRLDP